MNALSSIRSWRFSAVILYASLLCVGVFHEYLSCVLSAVLGVWLIVRVAKRRSFTATIDTTSLMMTLLVASYAVVSLWAVDRGVAILGFVKFLPLLLYTAVLSQDEGGREQAIAGFPYAVAVMTAISAVLMQIPALADWFSVVGRYAGFLQYPNTWALVTLVAELLVLTKPRLRWWDFGCMAVLLFGMVYTGSRAVLALAVIANVIGLFIAKNRVLTFAAIGCVAVGVLGVVGYCAAVGNWWLIERLTAFSVTDSNFIGRFLYAADILPTLVSHPFGTGYMGYHYLQQSLQTGVYSVMFVHNDPLQIALDVGWVPCLAFFGWIGRSLFSKTVSAPHKLIVGTMVAHALFDFDLQYVAVFLLLTLFTDRTPFKTVTVTRIAPIVASATAVCALCGYFGAALTLARLGLYRQADAVYPVNTKVDVELLKTVTDAEQMGTLADEILSRNEYVAVAYSAKARQAYAKGDFERVIRYKHKVFEMARFERAEYEEYAQMLATGISLYRQAGDTASADVCKSELLVLNDRMRAAKASVSKLGSMIATKPNLYFSTETWQYIEMIRAEGDTLTQ